MCSKLKSWWHFLKTLNIRNKTLKCAWQHFGIQSSLWINVKLDPMVKWRELRKINVHKIYNVHLFNSHRASSLWFMTHYQTKEKWKHNTMVMYEIFFFFLKVVVSSLKKEFIMHLLIRKCKKTHFLNGFSTKICKFLIGFKFSWCISISLTTKKSLQNSTHNCIFEIYICNFSYFVMCIFWHKYISYVQVCKCLLEFLFKKLFWV